MHEYLAEPYKQPPDSDLKPGDQSAGGAKITKDAEQATPIPATPTEAAPLVRRRQAGRDEIIGVLGRDKTTSE